MEVVRGGTRSNQSDLGRARSTWPNRDRAARSRGRGCWAEPSRGYLGLRGVWRPITCTSRLTPPVGVVLRQRLWGTPPQIRCQWPPSPLVSGPHQGVQIHNGEKCSAERSCERGRLGRSSLPYPHAAITQASFRSPQCGRKERGWPLKATAPILTSYVLKLQYPLPLCLLAKAVLLFFLLMLQWHAVSP